MSLADIETKIKDYVSKHKILIVLLAIPLVILKYRSVIIDLLVKDSRKILSETTEKDSALSKDQTVAATKADQIIRDADKAKEKANQQPVSEDWNK